ncbi:MAG: N-acetylmuramoyl-L-alanine amidase [Candidatus Babeliaceae bacterium]
MNYFLKMLFFFNLIIFNSFLYAFTLVIDPGHGGKFNGCTSSNGKLLEKNVTLSIAQKLATYLSEQENLQIILTRNTDKHLADELMDDLFKRVAIATLNNANLFISIHLNATSTNKEITNGFELYIPMHTKYPAQSYLLASFLHHQLSQHIPPQFAGNLGNLNKQDGGIRAAKFNVISRAPCPAVLVELDYLSNPAVEELYLSEEYHLYIAQILAQGLIEYVDYFNKTTL